MIHATCRGIELADSVMKVSDKTTCCPPQSTGPDFICIGAHKTGTTWLYETLRPHPEVYLTPVKELKYFWEEYREPNKGVVKRFLGQQWLAVWYRSVLKDCARRCLRNIFQLPRLRRELWFDIRFLFLPHNDSWYASLFANAPPRKGGDISPQYFSLPEPVVCRIHGLYPHAKIVILLREPIGRVWSWAKMALCSNNNKVPSEVSDEEFYKFFDMLYGLVPSYMAVVQTWKNYFSADQVFVGFYDQLLESPLSLYRDIGNFIGIDVERTPEHVVSRISQQYNVGLNFNVPDKYSVYLARQYLACVEEVCQEYRPYPQQWLKEYNELLSTADHNRD